MAIMSASVINSVSVITSFLFLFMCVHSIPLCVGFVGYQVLYSCSSSLSASMVSSPSHTVWFLQFLWCSVWLGVCTFIHIVSSYSAAISRISLMRLYVSSSPVVG